MAQFTFHRLFGRQFFGIQRCQFFGMQSKQYSTRSTAPKFDVREFKSRLRYDRSFVLLLSIPFTTFCLSVWQVYRLYWKRGLMNELEEQTRQPPITIPFDIKDKVKEFNYRRVKLTGSFDHSQEMLIQPRPLASATEHYLPGHRSKSGAHVVTRFYCNETKSYILVNRGWVPQERMNPSTRPHGQVEGDVELTGIVRINDNHSMFSPRNRPEKNYWAWRNVDELAQHAYTDPVFVDADATTTLKGGPIGGQTRIVLRNDHLQYVMTWWVLSLVTGYLCWKVWKRGKM